ncbi:hypothetical protein DE146DRAFT_627389 [Phaeosphaeria sp. MPI-PUGE-AT-0046c]|nr:hypothetical protein DE146DRAFT_627389 [Phaeosphaeria sp. MPI-PUGE-AT-0046c]
MIWIRYRERDNAIQEPNQSPRILDQLIILATERDPQSTTAREGRPVCYSIQMQVENRPKMTLLEGPAPDTVAKIEIPVDEHWSAVTISKELEKSLVAYADRMKFY